LAARTLLAADEHSAAEPQAISYQLSAFSYQLLESAVGSPFGWLSGDGRDSIFATRKETKN
jgi:hypothetical protein